MQDDGDVANFAGVAVSATEKAAVADDVETNTGTEIEHGEITQVCGFAKERFGKSGGIGVVFYSDWCGEGIAQEGGIHVFP